MCIEPQWTVYLAALLTPTIAVLGSFIAYRQWHLAQNKLKLDLFDRRFSVFEAARRLIASIMTSGKAKDEDVFKFLFATREAKWLLDASVAEYLDKQLYYKAIDLQTLDAELEGVPVREERTKNVRAQAEIKKWFAAQYNTPQKLDRAIRCMNGCQDIRGGRKSWQATCGRITTRHSRRR